FPAVGMRLRRALFHAPAVARVPRRRPRSRGRRLPSPRAPVRKGARRRRGMIPAGGVLRIAAALALPVTIAGVVFVLLAALQALAVGAARRARRLAMGGALAVLLYGGFLIGASLASSEVGLEPGQEKSFCGLDCDLKFSVTRLLTVPPRSPGSRAFYLTLRARSDARAVSIAPASLHAWLVSADGRQFDPASGRGVRIREGIAPGALVDL